MPHEFTTTQKLIRLVEKAWLPKPYLDNVEMAVVHAMVTNPKLQNNLPMVHVPIDQIQKTQWTLDRACVDKYAKSGMTYGGLTIKRRGEHFLTDGHHRYEAARQIGQTHFPTRVLSLPNRSLSLDTMAKKIGQTPKVITQAMDLPDRRQYESC